MSHGGGDEPYDPDAGQDYTPALLEARFTEFLNEYGKEDEDSLPLYVSLLAQMKAEDKSTLYVHLVHVNQYDMLMGAFIESRYNRIEPTLRKALHAFIREHERSMVEGTDGASREFFVAFYGQSPQRMRDLRTDKLGRLMCFTGTVTRSSEVRPELLLGAFKCGQCQAVKRGVPQQFKYSPPPVCDTALCGNRWEWGWGLRRGRVWRVASGTGVAGFTPEEGQRGCVAQALAEVGCVEWEGRSGAALVACPSRICTAPLAAHRLCERPPCVCVAHGCSAFMHTC